MGRTMTDQLTFCDPDEDGLPVHRPLARRDDPATSRETAATIAQELGKIQRLVLDAYRRHGPMTARKAERLPEFEEYGFSTIRKRISELLHEGYLSEAGVDRSARLSMSAERWSPRSAAY